MKRDVPLNVQRWRAGFGALLLIVGIVILVRSGLMPEESKQRITDIAFGILLIVFGGSRIVGIVRARRRGA